MTWRIGVDIGGTFTDVAVVDDTSGRIGFKTKRGFFEWDDASIAKERARYERAIRKCLEIFKEEGIL